MNTIESVIAGGLALVLGVFGLLIAWREVRTLRKLALEPGTRSTADSAFIKHRSIRRIVCSVLMLLIAFLLAGTFFMEPELQSITAKQRGTVNAGERPPLSDAEKSFLRRFTFYWISMLVLLFGILATASVDFWATMRRWFGMHRQLQQEHQASLQRELRRFHLRNNGSAAGGEIDFID